MLEPGECLCVHGEPRTGLDLCQETPADLPGGEPGLLPRSPLVPQQPLVFSLVLVPNNPF